MENEEFIIELEAEFNAIFEASDINHQGVLNS